jgi:hypothetical protein
MRHPVPSCDFQAGRKVAANTFQQHGVAPVLEALAVDGNDLIDAALVQATGASHVASCDAIG